MNNRVSEEKRQRIRAHWVKNPDMSCQEVARLFGFAAGGTVYKIVKDLPPHQHFATALYAGKKTRVK